MLEIFMTKGFIAATVIGGISLLLTTGGILPNNTPIVTTERGQVQGRTATSRNGQSYFEYLGIPFAEPPVGNLRFEGPVPIKESWNGVKSTTRYSSVCLQLDAMVRARLLGDEDCLYLNVMTWNTSPEKLKPVMVYIHGGGFFSGSTVMYGPYFLMDEDIVLVSMNYRLGPLGFANTEDEHIRGNMGMKDQQLAMKWVKANIAKFGGDPNRVTLFGESAGAASVLYHMVSPSSTGLFQRAIAMSGSLLCPWSFNKHPRQNVLKYLTNLNCPKENGTELVQCLKNMDGKELVKHQKSLMNPTEEFLAFVPSIESVPHEDAFLLEDPRQLWRKGKLSNKVPLLMGVTSGEGGVRVARFEAMPELIPLIDKEWVSLGPRIFSLDPFPGYEDVLQKVRQYYFGERNFTEDTHEFLKNFTTLSSDGLFYLPVKRAATIHAKQGLETYLYYYDYNSVILPSLYSFFRAVRSDDYIFSEAKLAVAVITDKVKKLFGLEGPHEYGVTHADDLLQMWNMEGWTYLFAGADSDFSKKFVKSFTDFAKNENKLTFDGVSWTPISKEEALREPEVPLRFMFMGNEEGRMIDEPFQERMKFLESFNLGDISI